MQNILSNVWDYDYFGDIRNRKALMDEDRYNKHSKNFKEKK